MWATTKRMSRSMRVAMSETHGRSTVATSNIKNHCNNKQPICGHWIEKENESSIYVFNRSGNCCVEDIRSTSTPARWMLERSGTMEYRAKHSQPRTLQGVRNWTWTSNHYSFKVYESIDWARGELCGEWSASIKKNIWGCELPLSLCPETRKWNKLFW